MIRSIVIFIAILIFVPINVTAQDSEDIVFELLLEAWDSLDVRAERIVRQERQTNDSLRTEIEVLKQSESNADLLQRTVVEMLAVFILLGVVVLGLFYYISRIKL